MPVVEPGRDIAQVGVTKGPQGAIAEAVVVALDLFLVESDLDQRERVIGAVELLDHGAVALHHGNRVP